MVQSPANGSRTLLSLDSFKTCEQLKINQAHQLANALELCDQLVEMNLSLRAIATILIRITAQCYTYKYESDFYPPYCCQLHY